MYIIDTIITTIIITISMITIIIIVIIIIIIMIIFKTWLFVDMEFFSLNIPRENPDLFFCMYYSLCKQQR